LCYVCQQAARIADNDPRLLGLTEQRMQTKPADSPVPLLQRLKQRTDQLVESQRTLQQECFSLQEERDQLLAQHRELSSAVEAHRADQATLITQLGEVTTERGKLQSELETARNTLEQILHLAHFKQESSAAGQEACRNCGSHRVIRVDRAGHVSPFFAARVFGLRSISAADLFLDAHLCIDCLFLTHAAKLPEESISRL